jgi:hypothetical protein
MPWKESTIMEQKIEFICEWRSGNYTITELCRSFEISRPTAYKIIVVLKMKAMKGSKNFHENRVAFILIRQTKMW